MTRRRKKTEDAAGTPAAKPRRSKPAGAQPPTPASAAQPVADGAPPLLMRAPIPVRWRDLDAFNHVNNANYLTFLEEARLQWLQSLPGPWVSEDVAPVLAAVQINYRRPIEWPAQLIVELYGERVGNTSITIGHRIVAENDPGIVYCDGNAVLVWIDRHSGKAAELPDAVRRGCGG
ncbi:MAG: acyl-CoA thioesterase [Rehaibacterium terrae]|uniref:acyl-CoA thioesterase n=1 Tax=Rehaibacterium terrae TaxID=1341696 RepID=UPI00391CE514